MSHLEDMASFFSVGFEGTAFALVWKYEQEKHAIEPAEPKDALRFLMDARNLKQEDLAAIVPQSNLSAILAGKRKISATLASKLGKFFGVSPAVFVPA